MGVLIKICGLRRPADARAAMALGADFGGVIGHPASPRYLELRSEAPLLAEIPEGRRVWVSVEPAPEEVESALDRGFDFVQVHFDPQGGFDPVSASKRFGAERLWLAPRLADPRKFQEAWIDAAEVFLIDGFAPDRMGGTGRRVEGEAFAELVRRYPGCQFVIAGGISPENVGEVLRVSGASQVDVNSGVEASPGVKDPVRLRNLFAAVREGAGPQD